MTARTHPPDKPVYTSADQCLADVDSFADWLQGECFQAPIVEPQSRGTHETKEFKAMNVAQLLAIILDDGQSYGELIDSRYELANRWLAHNRTEGNLE
jgi:hypothetical protein